MSQSTHAEADRIRSYFGEASWRQTDGRRMLVDERRRLLARIARVRLPAVGELTVCDVGCGAGADLEHWRSLGVAESRLFGTELVPQLAAAASGALPNASVIRVDGFEIPFPDSSFDLVTASLVLSSIRDPEGRRRMLNEMRRVARPGGLLAIYDFRIRKPWNRNVVAMSGLELAITLGPPRAEYRLAPFLPLLDLALRLPAPLRGAAVGVLPRTHRLWVWELPRHDATRGRSS